MAKDTQTIVDEIAAHIQEEGSVLTSWYVGITEDIEERLFGDHGVPKKNHWMIYREAISSDVARATEKALLDWGCDGGGGGGDDDAVFVYAYLKTAITNP